MGNTLKLDTSGFERLLMDIDELGGNVRKVTESALKQAGVQIMNETILAVAKPNLPAKGRYSLGDTSASIIHWPKVEWDGNTAWIPVGFDFSKPGAGGYLIEGTPRMSPDIPLRKLYKGKKFMAEIQKMMQNIVWDELQKLW